jgi:methionyl-tRNA formyltransferase
MRVIFFGSPPAALPSFRAVLAAGHEVVLALTQPDRPAGRGRHLASCPVKGFAQERGIPVVQPERVRKDPSLLERLAAAAPDLHVVVAYGQIISRAVIDLPRLGTINVHFSLLPRHRGASPVAWAILGGETRTGVTIFRLNEKMDEGDTLAAVEEEIRPDDTTGILEARLAEAGAGLLVRTLDRLETLPGVPQDHLAATYAPKLKKDDGRIDWGLDARAVDRRVRAMTPWPTAFAFLREERLILLEGRPLPSASVTATAGSVLGVGKDGIRVGCGEGTIYLITRLQPEGRKPMNSYAYSLSGKIGPGSVLG